MSEQPRWSAYRPQTLPPLSATSAGRGRLVVLAATDVARGEGWAQEITLGLARSWAGVGAEVLLIDCDLMTPGLHRLLHTDNGTGISDALLFGSSLGSMTVDVEDGRFAFVPAGSPLADPVAAFERSRWHDLANELVAGGTTVVVYAGAEAPWIDPLLAEASDLVVLASARDSASASLAGHALLRAAYGMGTPEDDSDDETDWLDPLDLDPLAAAPAEAWLDPLRAGDAIPADPVRAAEAVREGATDPTDHVDRADPVDPVDAADLASADPLGALDRSEDAESLIPASEPAGGGEDWEKIDARLRETPPDVPITTAALRMDADAGGVPGKRRRRRRSRGARRAAVLALAVVASGVAAWQFWPSGTTVSATAAEVSGPSAAAPAPADDPGQGGEEVSQEGAGPAAAEAVGGPAAAGGNATSVDAAAVGDATSDGATAGGDTASDDAAPGGAPASDGATPSTTPMIGAPPATTSTATTTPSDRPRFTVAFGAFGSETRAARLLDELRQAAPNELFFVAPVEVGGRVFHRVLGGGAASSADAARALAVLATATSKDASTLVVRETPMAFLASRAGSLDEARAVADSFRGEGLPAYVLSGPDGDGPVGYRVYVGAFLNEAEAGHMADLLRAAGHDVPLTERRGVPAG